MRVQDVTVFASSSTCCNILCTSTSSPACQPAMHSACYERSLLQLRHICVYAHYNVANINVNIANISVN